MATYITSRSTYWMVSEGPKVNNTPYADGDYRCFWSLYYEQTSEDRKPEVNRSKVIIDYFVQTHKQKSVYADVIPYSGTNSVATVKPGSSTQGTSQTIWTGDGSIVVGDNLALRYIGSKTWYIPHNADGTGSFTFSGKGFGLNAGETTHSLPKIDRYTLMGNISQFNVDDGVTINLTKYVTSFYDKLEILYGSKVIKTINNITKDYTANTSTATNITFTEAELDTIYSTIPTGSSATFTFKLTTYSNSSYTTVIGSQSKTATGNFTIVLPTFSNFSYYDDDTEAVDATGSNQTIISGVSDVYVTISTEQLAKANTREATISHYIINGRKVNSTGNAISYRLGSVTSNKVTIQAVDTRGEASLVVTKEFTKYIAYNRVSVNTTNWLLTRRDNGVGRLMDISFEATWYQGSFGNVTNKLTPYVFYRDTEDGYWTDMNEFIKGASIGRLDETKIDTSTPGVVRYNGQLISAEDDAGFDVQVAYDMFIGFQDTFSDEGLTITAPYGQPAAAIYKNKMALGGPYDEQLGGTQLWGDVYVNGDLYAAGNSGDNGSGGSNAHEYSTDEIIIGTWVDGKPIYRKVYFFDCATINYSAVYKPHGITNLETIVTQKCNWLDGSGTVNRWRAIPANYYVTLNWASQLTVDMNNITFELGDSTYSRIRDSGKQLYVILEYTKTTD